MMKCLVLVTLALAAMVVELQADKIETPMDCKREAQKRYESICKTDKERAKKCATTIYKMGISLAQKADSNKEISDGDYKAADAAFNKCLPDTCDKDKAKKCGEDEYKNHKAAADKIGSKGKKYYQDNRDAAIAECDKALKSDDCK